MENSSVLFRYVGVEKKWAHKQMQKDCVRLILKEELGHSHCSLTFVFCTDSFLLELNLSHLKHNTLTDIITFDLSDGSNTGLQGEIYISVERVLENAMTYDVSFFQEISRVIFHGVLHLCGYKDKKKADQAIMRQREDYYLNKFNIL